MPSYTYKLKPGEVSGAVNEAHFGANFRGMQYGIGDAFDMLGVTHLRYPAGAAQLENITHMENGELNARLQEFLSWVAERGTSFTLSVPVGELLATQSQMQEFVNAVYDKLGENGYLLRSFEISNEYWSFQSAAEYGNDSSKAVTYLKHAVDELNSSRAVEEVDPSFLVQTAPPWYVNPFTMDQKNLDIIRHFDANKDLSDGLQATVASEAIDGIVSHYYYYKNHGDDNTFSDGYYELRQIGPRTDMWDLYFDRDLDYHITEWNVQNKRMDQQGLKAASVILKQFENMLEVGVDAADVWSIRNKNYNSLAGGTLEENPIYPTPPGQVFMWMGESLFDENGEGLSLVDLYGIPKKNRPIEFNTYTGAEKTVLYASSRTNDFGVTVDLDLTNLVDYTPHISVRKMGILDGSSDGLSDRAAFEESGRFVTGSRNALRIIDKAEKDAIEAKFINVLELGVYERYHIGRHGEESYRTYVPDPSTILLKPGKTPETATSLDDYYFATEVDVAMDIDQFYFEDPSDVQLEFDPYEVVEITLQPLANVGVGVPGILGDIMVSPNSENPGLNYAEIHVTPEDGECYAVQADRNGQFDLALGDSDASIQLELSMSYKTDSGQVDVQDALETLRLSIGLDPTWGTAKPENYLAADFDRDGVVSAYDALAILHLAMATPDNKEHEWVFIDADEDLSFITKDSVDYETDISVQVEDDMFELSLTSFLLGNVEEI
ncbi:hypothetical protein RKLH11_3228 [Rhodobacteraceae bacterium KLH11]|nr:hypothetical protein RKLH11_3228 [Rhodobacteraceae bacterium KLH11]